MDHALTLFGNKLLEVALPSLATILASLAIAFLTKKLQSLGITIDAQQQAQLRELAAHTVLALEEQARRNPALTGDQKNAIAVETIQKRLPDAKIDDVHLAVDAALPQVRQSLPAATSFGDKAKQKLEDVGHLFNRRADDTPHS